jgi:hypothetical protein
MLLLFQRSESEPAESGMGGMSQSPDRSASPVLKLRHSMDLGECFFGGAHLTPEKREGVIPWNDALSSRSAAEGRKQAMD